MRRTLLVIQAAIATAVLIYGGVGYALRRPEEEASAILTWLTPLLVIVIIALFPTLWVLRRATLAASGHGVVPATQPSRSVLPGRWIILFALAELPAIFGLVMALLGASPITLFLSCGASLFYLALLIPPEDLPT